MMFLNCGHFSFTYSIQRSIEAFPLPLIFNVSSDGRSAANVSMVIVLITPGPTIPSTLAFSIARFFTPTPGIPAVRYALSKFADINDNGAPVFLSFSIIIKMERGSPTSRFSTLEPYHFMPAISNLPPTYAGIAIKRLSGPFAGIFGNSG